MMTYIYIYIAIGVFLNLIYDLLISYVLIDREELRFTIMERLFMCLTWPIAATIFTIRTIKIYIDSKKK